MGDHTPDWKHFSESMWRLPKPPDPGWKAERRLHFLRHKGAHGPRDTLFPGRERECVLRWAGLSESESGPSWPLCVRARGGPRKRERCLHGQPTGPDPLDHRDDFITSALRNGSWKSLFQEAFYLPSCETGPSATPAHSGCFGLPCDGLRGYLAHTKTSPPRNLR